MSSLAEVTSSATIKAGLDDDARNARVMANQGLVHQVARGFLGRGIALEDLVQFGNIGLIRAAEKFEPGRGLKFSTYAVYWIRQAIHKGIATASRPIRVPSHARREAAIVHRCVKEIEAETGRKPWPSEAVDKMGLPDHKKMRLVRAAEADTAKFGVKPLEELGEACPGTPPELSAINSDHREQLARALPLLCEDHRKVLTWKYGLGGEPAMVTAAVAASLGVSWRAAEQMERQAIRELKRLLNQHEE